MYSVHHFMCSLFGHAQVRTRNAVQNAQQYIENEFEEEAELCNYGLALSAYALQGTVPSKNTAVKNGLISALRSRITTSKTCTYLRLPVQCAVV